MKTLISMTDFVLEQYKNNYHANTPTRILNYANFLKQHLELWMFVPCDEDGNVLNEPYNFNEFLDGNNINTLCEDYQQAKEICIFNNNLLSLIEIKELISKNKTIEFLINYYYEKTGGYLETNKELF